MMHGGGTMQMKHSVPPLRHPEATPAIGPAVHLPQYAHDGFRVMARRHAMSSAISTYVTCRARRLIF
jgi:hypothetical protein